MLALGHPSAEADLESWLQNADGPPTIIAAIAAAYPDEAGRLQKRLANTAAMKAAGVDPAALIPKEADQFEPYLNAEGEDSVPHGICIFGMTGGHERWTVIRIPKRILALPIPEQLAALPKLMLSYKRRYRGEVPFFGKLRGFKYVRFNDYYQFDAEGQLLQNGPGRFSPGPSWVEHR
ncbi:MAG TPA: hypothetical protein VME43_17020 [Bryobacteraceae bacterium]|nr:hypothetical protein [Bryobacteraceae bacterium]